MEILRQCRNISYKRKWHIKYLVVLLEEKKITNLAELTTENEPPAPPPPTRMVMGCPTLSEYEYDDMYMMPPPIQTSKQPMQC